VIQVVTDGCAEKRNDERGKTIGRIDSASINKKGGKGRKKGMKNATYINAHAFIHLIMQLVSSPPSREIAIVHHERFHQKDRVRLSLHSLSLSVSSFLSLFHTLPVCVCVCILTAGKQ